MFAAILLLTLLTLVSARVEREARTVQDSVWTKVKDHMQSPLFQQEGHRLLEHLIRQHSIKGNCSGLLGAETILTSELEQLDAIVEKVAFNTCGKSIVARIGNNPLKKTVLIYAHYDVVAANKGGNDWRQLDPFQLVNRKDDNGRSYYYGRGVSDDKGQVVAWLQAIKAWKRVKGEIPVNLKIIFDAEEETGSRSLNIGLTSSMSELPKFVASADCVIFTDGVGLNDEQPSFMLGLRGINFFNVEISGPKSDFHSGTHGGVLYEPMTDLVRLLASLQKAPQANQPTTEQLIQIRDLYRDVASDHDIDYEALDFDVEMLKKEVGVDRLLYANKKELLRHLWSLPSVTIHRIESKNEGTSIAAKVTAQISFRLAPGQNRMRTKRAVENFLAESHKESGSPNRLVIREMGADPWVGRAESAYFQAVERAVRFVYDRPTNRVRSGGTIGIIASLAAAAQGPVIMLPLGHASDGMHSANERISVENLNQGTMALARALYEISMLDGGISGE